MLCLLFAFVERRRPLLPRRGHVVTAMTGAALALAATISVGADNAGTPASLGGLAGSGVEMVPADAAFLSATLRAREQYDRLVKSNAFASIKELPAVARALDSLEEQRTMPGSPLSTLDTLLQLPENEQAVELLSDMVATDTFVYGEPSCISFLTLLQKIQQVQRTEAVKQASRDGMIDRDALPVRAAVQACAENLDLVVVPDVVWGFKTTKADAGRSQLKRIEVLAKLMTQANPDLADSLARTKVAGGEFITFTVQGDRIPWEEFRQNAADALGEVEGFDKVLDRLRSLDIVIALGVVGDRVILSIGDSVEHLEKLALPGSGRKGLLATAPFAPLLAHKDKPLTGISYISGELAEVTASSASNLESFGQLAGESLESSDVPAAARADLRQLFAEAATDLGKRLPTPGPWMSFSFLADQGYEGYAWDWARNQSLDGTKRLTLLGHAGGTPLGVLVSRLKADPAALDDLVALATKGWSLTKKHVVADGDDDARERAEEFDEHIVPLGEKLVAVLRKKIFPSLADGQIGFVLDAKTTTKRLQRELPESTEPLPIVEPAIVLPLANRPLFIEGMNDLFALSDELVEGIREMDADAVPEGYEVPDPESSKVEGGTVWSFAMPESGVDDQVRPAIGVGEKAAVLSLVPKQAGRLLGESRLETGSQLSRFEEPLAGAAALDFAGLVDAVKPWVVYVTRYGCVQQRDGEVDADTELTADVETDDAKEALRHAAVVLEALKSFRTAVAEQTVTDGATVTHWRNIIRDTPKP